MDDEQWSIFASYRASLSSPRGSITLWAAFCPVLSRILSWEISEWDQARASRWPWGHFSGWLPSPQDSESSGMIDPKIQKLAGSVGKLFLTPTCYCYSDSRYFEPRGAMVFRGNGDQVSQQMRWISPTCPCRAEVTFVAATAGENEKNRGRTFVASQFPAVSCRVFLWTIDNCCMTLPPKKDCIESDPFLNAVWRRASQHGPGHERLRVEVPVV